ncbi:hypothetical protein [Halomonas ventosae]|uniref:hypothetical protein n=1 Tax=Halomonas ventosae TaxID=229007 RepID=UPI0040451A84
MAGSSACSTSTAAWGARPCASPTSRGPIAEAKGPKSRALIDLYYWTTPNGHKVSIFLKEAGLEYVVKPVNIGRGEQFAEEFLEIAPNNRIPAIVDRAPAEGAQFPLHVALHKKACYVALQYGVTGPGVPPQMEVFHEQGNHPTGHRTVRVHVRGTRTQLWRPQPRLHREAGRCPVRRGACPG